MPIPRTRCAVLLRLPPRGMCLIQSAAEPVMTPLSLPKLLRIKWRMPSPWNVRRGCSATRDFRWLRLRWKISTNVRQMPCCLCMSGWSTELCNVISSTWMKRSSNSWSRHKTFSCGLNILYSNIGRNTRQQSEQLRFFEYYSLAHLYRGSGIFLIPGGQADRTARRRCDSNCARFPALLRPLS